MKTLPRLYPILDTGALEMRGLALVETAAAMLEGGARILQIRHKGLWSGKVFEDAREVATLCRQAGAALIVNDRADIAKLLGAGLHVGQDDLSPADARALLGDGATIGYSSHHAAQLRDAAAEPVDYIALGPIFSTSSKQSPDPAVGIDELRRCRALVGKPLVGIGGITRENARAVFDAGADAVAVIADLLPASATAADVRRRIEEWRGIADAGAQ
ncbi:MAG TPA: thiamine phosphate synthase [Bryobacteraceae bacterium]